MRRGNPYQRVMKARGLTQSAYARELNIARQHLWQLLNSERFPGRELSVRIITNSQGLITRDELEEWSLRESRKRKREMQAGA